MSMKTREQEMAKSAWEHTEQVNKNQQEKYLTLVRKLPSLIMTNGLGQTLAYLKAKAEGNQQNHHYIAYKTLSNWVIPQVFPDKKTEDFLEILMEKNSLEYRQATGEALALAGWLKRFAEAEFGSSTGS